MAVECAYNNIEYSLIDYIAAQLSISGYSNVTVSKNYKNVEAGQLPTIVVGLLNSTPKRREVGSNSLTESPQVVIRIFATTDGERATLAQWLLTKLMGTVDFNTYTINNGTATHTHNGYIHIVSILSNGKEYEFLEGLEPEDRFRHKIAFTVSARGLTR